MKNRLEELRSSRGWTQQQLAEAGLSTDAIAARVRALAAEEAAVHS